MNNDKRQKILDAAIQTFTKKGFKGTNVREIAKHAGVTTGAIYYYYKNKEELLSDVLSSNFIFVNKFSERQGNKLLSQTKILSKIQERIKVRMKKENEQKLYIQLFATMLTRDENIQNSFKTSYKNIFEKVSNLFYYAFGIENEKYKKQLAIMLVAAIDGMAMQYALGLQDVNDDEFIDTFIDFFTKSIRNYLLEK